MPPSAHGAATAPAQDAAMMKGLALYAENRYQTVEELVAGEQLQALKLRDVHSGEVREIEVDGVFISIGRAPETQLFRDQIELDASGYIVAGEDMRTNLPGVFAAGDVRTKTLRQIVTAVSDGAQAAQAVEEYLAEHG